MHSRKAAYLMAARKQTDRTGPDWTHSHPPQDPVSYHPQQCRYINPPLALLILTLEQMNEKVERRGVNSAEPSNRYRW